MKNNSYLPSADGSNSSLSSMISRLKAVIENETEKITGSSDFDFKGSSEKKSRLLFDLNRTCRTLDLTRLDDSVLEDLSLLKKALALNEARIRVHLTAVREVSTIMVNILQNEDADGTYGEHI